MEGFLADKSRGKVTFWHLEVFEPRELRLLDVPIFTNDFPADYDRGLISYDKEERSNNKSPLVQFKC